MRKIGENYQRLPVTFLISNPNFLLAENHSNLASKFRRSNRKFLASFLAFAKISASGPKIIEKRLSNFRPHFGQS